jgi:hypothetical protein
MKLTPTMIRRVEQHNRSHPNHPPIMLWYNPRSVKAKWETRLLGVPVRQWRYQGRWEVGVRLPSRPRGFHRLMRYLGRGQWFMKLFTWHNASADGADTGYLAPDERIFHALALMDTTRPRHYATTVEEPEAKLQADVKKEHNALAKAGAEYYAGYDNLIVPVGPGSTTGRRDWRHRIR